MYLADLVIVVGETLASTTRFGISVVLAVAVLTLAVVACESAGMGTQLVEEWALGIEGMILTWRPGEEAWRGRGMRNAWWDF